ncbi:hydroxyacid dehydrogenase [Pseudomonas syringae]|uniref:Hydroxyacid dehydrogenase n=1 Tax=Pseudomonas syringae TaxID=317 RepID=A0A1C7Z3C3_PSESX|nr:2-hydroxyacid dehydrogenase [Pseudomonas syringae]OCR24441.1 hydroxyacid dehydrogenase [Pseudomonas syringae]
MIDSKGDVLVWGPMHASLMQALEANVNVHKRWEIADFNSWAVSHAEAIRVVVTSGVYGADNATLDKLPNLEAITSFGVGYDAVDTAYLAGRGIQLSNTPDVLNNSVAETALALMLCVSRRISEAERFVRAGKWQQAKFPLGNDLHGKTCGIVGLGKIGKTIARLVSAFDMHVAYFRPSGPYADVSYTHYADLQELAAAADYLVVIVPGGADTRHLINREVMRALGPSSFLINVARGTVVDEAALVAALLESEVGGAGLDVFDDEPNVPAELITMDNVVLLPHIGSGTHETRQAMADLVYTNLAAWFEQGKLVTPVSL